MKFLLKPAFAVGLAFAAAGTVVATPAAAQVVKGIGVIDPGFIVVNSAAYQLAESQRPVTYKQYYDAATARNDQINAQIKPLAEKFETDRKAPNPNVDALQKQYAAIQAIDQQGERDLKQILQPVAMSQQYVKEQLEDVLPKAIEAAAAKKNITLILDSASGAVFIRDQSYNFNADVLAEINALLPVAQLSPPPTWQPREVRERLAAQQAAQNGGQAPASAAPAAPTGAPVDSR